MNFKRT